MDPRKEPRYSPSRVRPGPVSKLENPAFRSRVVSLAATGMSRVGVAASAGMGKTTLISWIERGLAFPDLEPYGSFSQDYLRAERALERAGSTAISWVIQRVTRLMHQIDDGEHADATPEQKLQGMAALELLMKNPQLKEMLNVLEARFPEDWGKNAHRIIDQNLSGQSYLEENAMDRDQLAALLSDPPDVLRLAMQDAAMAIYTMLLEGGFRPPATLPSGGESHEGT